MGPWSPPGLLAAGRPFRRRGLQMCAHPVRVVTHRGDGFLHALLAHVEVAGPGAHGVVVADVDALRTGGAVLRGEHRWIWIEYSEATMLGSSRARRCRTSRMARSAWQQQEPNRRTIRSPQRSPACASS